MTPLERRCRLLLRAYPAAYRRDRGEEIIGTLLEATPAGRSWPLARDIRGLVMGGLRARAALNRRQTTAANLRIAVLVGAAGYLAFSAGAYLRVGLLILAVPQVPNQAGWPALIVAVLVAAAVAMAWVGNRRAVLVAAAIAAVGVSLTASWHDAQLGWPTTELACLAALALLAGRAEPPGRHWLWPVALAAAVPLTILADDLAYLGNPYVASVMPGVGRLVLGGLLVAVGIVCVLWFVIDARPAFAAAVFLLAFWLPSGIDNLARGAGVAAGVPLLALVTAVAALGGWRLRRQSAGATAGPRN
jgi:hypothetical protein